MTEIEEIKRAVESLSAEELARFREWFELFDASVFDAKIEADAKAGRLDRFAERALSEHAKRKARPTRT